MRLGRNPLGYLRRRAPNRRRTPSGTIVPVSAGGAYCRAVLALFPPKVVVEPCTTGLQPACRNLPRNDMSALNILGALDLCPVWFSMVRLSDGEGFCANARDAGHSHHFHCRSSLSQSTGYYRSPTPPSCSPSISDSHSVIPICAKISSLNVIDVLEVRAKAVETDGGIVFGVSNSVRNFLLSAKIVSK